MTVEQQLGEKGRTALSEDLDENGQISRSLSIPRLERLKQLESVALGVNSDANTSSVFRGRLESILSGVISARGKFMTTWISELKCLAISSSQGIGKRVEGKVSSENHGGHDIGGSNESMGGGVSIIASSEVTVVRSDN